MRYNFVGVMLKIIPYILRLGILRDNILFFGLMGSLTLAGISQYQAINMDRKCLQTKDEEKFCEYI